MLTGSQIFPRALSFKVCISGWHLWVSVWRLVLTTSLLWEPSMHFYVLSFSMSNRDMLYEHVQGSLDLLTRHLASSTPLDTLKLWHDCIHFWQTCFWLDVTAFLFVYILKLVFYQSNLAVWLTTRLVCDTTNQNRDIACHHGYFEFSRDPFCDGEGWELGW